MNYTTKEAYLAISKQFSDPILERKSCRLSWKEFPLFSSERDRFKKFSYDLWNSRITIPYPTLCPEERIRRRLMFRNERVLYKRNCDFTWKEIISIYSPEHKQVVYKRDIWWSDMWDAMKTGVQMDFTRPFFEQFAELREKTPTPNVFITDSENSEYCNHVGEMKSCFMVTAAWRNDMCLYSSNIRDCVNCCDLLECSHCHWSYECTNCEHCYKLFWSESSEHCKDSMFLTDCLSCSSCLWCWWLEHKEYHIFNKASTKEQYEKTKKRLLSSNEFRQQFLQTYLSLRSVLLQHERWIKWSDACLWDKITDSSNSLFCFNVWDAQDCLYCENGALWFTDCQDWLGIWVNSSLMYEIIDTGLNSTRCFFSAVWHSCPNSTYIWNCHTSSYLFWCAGLRDKKYCILNTQYTQHEFETLVPKIINHMKETWERGEFFPASCSPFCYNETRAQDYFPCTKDQAVWNNWKWLDSFPDPKVPQWIETLCKKNFNSLQRDTLQQDSSIYKKVFSCEKSSRPYRIQPVELKFYHTLWLPLPSLHPDKRHLARFLKRPGRSAGVTYASNWTEKLNFLKRSHHF